MSTLSAASGLQRLSGRRVAIWGWGREGRSLFRALRSHQPALPIALLNDQPLAATERARLEGDGVEVIEGQALSSQLTQFDTIIKSPGISAYRDDLQQALRNGVEITSALQLWLEEHPNERTICITGTKGKSTTAAALTHALRHLGASVALGGNIGLPLFDIEESASLWVIEVSSYQAWNLRAKPTLAILLNLFPEHMNWHGSVERYFYDKLTLLREVEQLSLINAEDRETRRFIELIDKPRSFVDAAHFHLRDEMIYRADQRWIDGRCVALPGRHNLVNLCAVLSAIEALGLDSRAAAEALQSFRALPHRLQPVLERAGRLWVDDSISTTPQSAIAAVLSFPRRPITLLLGGQDRGQRWDELAHFLTLGHVRQVILMSESGRAIAAALEMITARDPALQSAEVRSVSNLTEAVELAHRIAPQGGVILLSPAAPSYGEFTNFEERGDCFADLARAC